MESEIKYSGLTKLKVIEQLLKIVSEKRSLDDLIDNDIMMNLESSGTGQRSAKRHRKSDHPNRLNVTSDHNSSVNVLDVDLVDDNVRFCKNLACRAKLSQDGAFCKRCSCCICCQYDDNKDPSLWLTCSSDPPFKGTSCGMSCHLECALKHEKSGIPKDGQSRGLDGSFYCVSCGKVNDLLGCWRKQMMIAKDTRRVDILCYRVSLSQKLLIGTLRYQKLHEIVNQAMEKLEEDVGPLTGLPVKRARGIVNRLSSGQEVQKLCCLAIQSLDAAVLPNPTIIDQTINGNLKSPTANSSSLSNPSSVEDENNAIFACKTMTEKQKDKKVAMNNETINIIKESSRIDEINCIDDKKDFDPFVGSTSAKLPITPCKTECIKDSILAIKTRSKSSKKNLENGSEGELPEDHQDQQQDGSSSRKRSIEETDGRDFRYYVKVIRRLECNGHIDMDFRKKFLTWYSLRASPQEIRIVKVFVDTFMEDMASLAGQLEDAFSEVITNKKCSSTGLCLKLFH